MKFWPIFFLSERGGKMVQCDICLKTFKCNAYLERHHRVHTNKSLLNAKLVRNYLHNYSTSKFIKEFILEETNLNVKLARKHFHMLMSSKSMREFTMVKNHMNVKLARKHFQNQADSRLMKEFILVKNHMNARCAIKHFHNHHTS